VPDHGWVTGHDPWAAQDTLARTTTRWGGAGTTAGLSLVVFQPGPWSCAFGLQNATWGAVDLAVVIVSRWLQARRAALSPSSGPRGTAAAPLAARRCCSRRRVRGEWRGPVVSLA
jgi:hypothetical protein